MKLKFDTKNNIGILTVIGVIDAHQFAVLKVGIARFLGDKKKNVVLHLSNVEEINDDAIHEIATLDIGEYSGKIVLSGVRPELKQKILAVCPTIAIFDDDVQASESFRPSPERGAVDDPTGLKEQLAVKEKEIEALKAQIKRLESGKSNDGAQYVDFVTKNKQLEEQLRVVMRDRRIPPDAEAVKHKIAALEATIEEMTKKMQTKEKK